MHDLRPTQPPAVLALTDRTVDLATGTVSGGTGATLTDRERALLAYLAARPCETVSRDELLEQVWGYSKQVISRAADNAMRRLREKVEADPSKPTHLVSIFGVGYRFVPKRPDPNTLTSSTSVPAPAPAPAPSTPDAPKIPSPAGPLRRARQLFLADRTVDLDRAVVVGAEGEVALTAIEVGLLEVLAGRKGAIVERGELVRAVWEDTTRAATVGSALHRLRAKLEADPAEPRHLQTVRGVGYRLKLDAHHAQGRGAWTLVNVGLVPVEGSWEEAEDDQADAIAPLVRWLAQQAASQGGIRLDAGWRFAFSSPAAAIAFATTSHREAPLQETGGLRLRAGIHHGQPILVTDPTTGQASVVGPETHRASDLLRRAPPGATVIDAGAWAVAGGESGLCAVEIGYGAVQVGGAQVAASKPAVLPWVGDRYVGREALFHEVMGALEGGARLVSLVGAAGGGQESARARGVCTGLAGRGGRVRAVGRRSRPPGLPRGGRRRPAAAPPSTGRVLISFTTPCPTESRPCCGSTTSTPAARKRQRRSPRGSRRSSPCAPSPPPDGPSGCPASARSRWSPSTMTTRSRCSWSVRRTPTSTGTRSRRWCASSTGCPWRSSLRRRGRRV